VLKLYEVDAERLGRYHDNCLHGTKRKRSALKTYGSITHNADRLSGGKLFRALGAHDDDTGHHSVQQFVGNYGRGPYLIPVALYIHSGECITSCPEPS
jgi:hypothetical protein